MIQIRFTIFGLAAMFTAGLVYYLILDTAGWWLFLSVLGLHIIMAHLTTRAAYSSASNVIGTLAEECAKLARYIQVLVKENKELKAKLGVKDTP